jgi:REP element-mobilizing transposase RayT
MRPRFRPFSELRYIEAHRRNLPHWESPGATYFLTFRLADSLPAGLLRELQIQRSAWLRAHSIENKQSIEQLESTLRKEYHRRFTAQEQRWLDEGYGRCLLRRSALRKHVAAALHHFDDERYLLDAFVIMPNHVHALILPLAEHSRSDITASWKKFSARQINGVLNERGTLWQEETYDHIVRDTEQLESYRQYIAANPVKARLRPDEYTLGNGSGVEL